MSRSDIIVELIEAVLSNHGDRVEKAVEELCAQEADKWDSGLADRIERLLYRAQRGNSGDHNRGHSNTGNYNTGSYNSGFYNSGFYNSGWYNSGNWNTGAYNSGSFNAGYHNAGEHNAGDHNAGDHNAGDYNTASYVVGYFNTESQKLKLFDQETDMTFEQWQESEAMELLWVLSKNMAEEEKGAYPEHNTTGGFLRKCDNADACNKWWEDLSESKREIIRSIPNFDAQKFYTITGIRV